MAKLVKAHIKDLIDDDKNANKGSEFGDSLMDKSFTKFGAGRSVLIDKNNRIIAGNKSKNKFGELGGENILIVDADKDTLVAVRRNDIDLSTPEGREFAIADNATNKANLVWDADVVSVIAESVEVEDWGIDIGVDKVKIDNKLPQIDDVRTVTVEYASEGEKIKLLKFLRQLNFSYQIN